MLPLHTLLFCLRISDGLKSHLGSHNSMHKFLSHFHRYGRYYKPQARSSSDLWLTFWGPITWTSRRYWSRWTQLPKVLVKMDSTAPKLTPICPTVSCRILLQSHISDDQIVHKLNIFIYSSLFRVPRLFIILHTLPPSPEFSGSFFFFFYRAVRRLIPKGFIGHHEFPSGTYPSFMTALTSALLIFSV